MEDHQKIKTGKAWECHVDGQEVDIEGRGQYPNMDVLNLKAIDQKW